MFWKKREKPKVVCLKIAENLPVLYVQDADIIQKIERVFPPLGALVARFDYEGGVVCATMFKKDLTVQEIIDALAKLGLHATLIEED